MKPRASAVASERVPFLFVCESRTPSMRMVGYTMSPGHWSYDFFLMWLVIGTGVWHFWPFSMSWECKRVQLHCNSQEVIVWTILRACRVCSVKGPQVGRKPQSEMLSPSISTFRVGCEAHLFWHCFNSLSHVAWPRHSWTLAVGIWLF